MTKPKVVILGAGYGGLMTAVRLQKMIGVNDADVKLVNKNPYHYETTWLHEASAGTLHPDKVRYNIRDVINNNKIEFVEAAAVMINKEEKTVILEEGQLEYDYLVVSLGAEAETFGIEGLKEYAFSIISLNSARQIRDHMELQLATYNNEPSKREERLTIIVGGAGFTGIEFLGELTDRMPKLCSEYDIDRDKVRIICVEAAPTILPGFDEDLIAYAKTQLEEKGVEFVLGTAIKKCTEDGIIVTRGESEEEIKAGTVIWSAGIRGNPLIEKSGFESIRGRVQVKDDLRYPNDESIFVLGDCSLVIDKQTKRPYPPTAQIAMQQGELCAKNIAALLKGKTELSNFTPNIRGTVCSLGDDDAVGIAYGKKLIGTKASLMKKVIDNRALLMIGGPSLLMKKGKFNVL